VVFALQISVLKEEDDRCRSSKSKRPYQERFLDNFDRSQLRREVEAVRPRRRFAGLKKKYTTWALGASLALGGIGTPLAMMQTRRQARRIRSPWPR
jgi:hypothetical protein